MPPLTRYIVVDSGQEILDKVAASISSRRTKMVTLELKPKHGNTRTVDFHIDGTGHDELEDLITGITSDKQSINVSVPKDGSHPTALLRS